MFSTKVILDFCKNSTYGAVNKCFPFTNNYCFSFFFVARKYFR